jgi:hypothetical protein
MENSACVFSYAAKAGRSLGSEQKLFKPFARKSRQIAGHYQIQFSIACGKRRLNAC